MGSKIRREFNFVEKVEIDGSQVRKIPETGISNAVTYIKKNGGTKAVKQNLESLQGILQQFKHGRPRVVEWINKGAL